MREQSFPADEESAIKNQVPSPPSVRKSKRKMDRSRLGGRGLFKNPPQPHMCIKDVLVDSQEPCFINVLSWDKISTPAYPEDTIPLYGGIQIICNSMNSLVCTEFLKGIEPGKQPAIFAVVVNPQILKMSGKNAEEANRDSFIYLIEDFVENMNENVKFQHQFTVLGDRDVVGELKDIWFIIQSKREAERAELSAHGDGDRNLTSRHNATPKAQKQPPQLQENVDDVSLQQLWTSLDLQEKQKVPVPHFHSHANGGGKESGWLYSQRDKKVYQDRKITDFIPTYRKDQDELVWTSQLQYPPKLSATAGHNYTASFLSKRSKSFWTEGNASKAAPPSFQESIDNKVRGFAQIRNPEKHNHKHVLPKREKPLPLPKSRGANKLRLATAADPRPQFESFETDKEEDNMFDRVRQVVATKILPSLDHLDNEYGEISSPYFALEEVDKKPYKEVATEDRGENVNSLQLSELSDALLSLNKFPKKSFSSVSEDSSPSCAEVDDLIQDNLSLESIKDGSSPPLEMVANKCKLVLKPDNSENCGHLKHPLQNFIKEVDSNGETDDTIYRDVTTGYETSAGNLPSAELLDRNNVQKLLNEVNKNVIGVPAAVKIGSFCANCCGEVGNKEDNINLDISENLEALAEITSFSNSKAKLSSESVMLAEKNNPFLADKAGMMINHSGNGIVRRSKSFTDLNFSIQGGNDQRSNHLRDN